jgi:hypothetical protein
MVAERSVNFSLLTVQYFLFFFFEIKDFFSLFTLKVWFGINILKFLSHSKNHAKYHL